MARSVSQTFRTAAFAQETGEAFLLLVSVAHASLNPTLRFTSDAVDTVSNGNTYQHYPFELVLPEVREREVPRARLVIDNVDRKIIAGVRALPSAADIDLTVVLASDPDTVEIAWTDFELRTVFWDALTIEGDLTVEHLLGVPYPGFVYSPATHPGLF